MMNIVGRNNWQSKFVRHRAQVASEPIIKGEVVVLQFNVQAIFAKKVN